MQGWLHPEARMPDPISWGYFAKMDAYIKSRSMTATVLGNLTNGKKAVHLRGSLLELEEAGSECFTN